MNGYLCTQRVAPSWKPLLETFFRSPEGLGLTQFLEKERRQQKPVYPEEHPFYALELTPAQDVRVVILGQDPYPTPHYAQGLAFHVHPGQTVLPRSLRNIHKELSDSLGIVPPTHGSLLGWAKQGVLLLNTVLTVEGGKAGSHCGKGWEALTDSLLAELNQRPQPIVFLLWGKKAQRKAPLLTHLGHLILQANHPSPLSATKGPVPFLGCGHFRLCNQWLQSRGERPIRWEFFG